MQNISVTRYAHPRAVGWAGYIEPADKSWIAYIGLDGRPRIFLHRDPQSGAILPDDPGERALHLDALRGELAQPRQGGHIGELAAGTGATYHDGQPDPHEPWERIHPLGETSGGGDVIPRSK